MFEILPFIACVVLRYHFGDHVPIWAWVLSLFILFSDPTLRLKGLHPEAAEVKQ